MQRLPRAAARLQTSSLPQQTYQQILLHRSKMGVDVDPVRPCYRRLGSGGGSLGVARFRIFYRALVMVVATAAAAALLMCVPAAAAPAPDGTAASTVAAAGGFTVPTLSFDDGYSYLFGDANLVRLPDGRSVRLLLNQYTGSGFISSDYYSYGFFSASIKLPANYTAGVVVAFYMSNGDVFEKTHDELDFEFLGNVPGRAWLVQTNIYGNGSTARGREERYVLPFDPTLRPHQYSILWTKTATIFYVDDVPIRTLRRSLIPSSSAGDYPSKPMALYATIWDGSGWATESGKYKVNYKYSPFASDFSHLVIRGCPTSDPAAAAAPTTADDDYDPIRQIMTPPPSPTMLRQAARCAEADDEFESALYAVLTPDRMQAMRDFRRYQMVYTYCYDGSRYADGYWPECLVYGSEKDGFWPQTGQNRLRIPQSTITAMNRKAGGKTRSLPSSATTGRRRRRSRRSPTTRSATPNVQTDAAF